MPNSFRRIQTVVQTAFRRLATHTPLYPHGRLNARLGRARRLAVLELDAGRFSQPFDGVGRTKPVGGPRQVYALVGRFFLTRNLASAAAKCCLVKALFLYRIAQNEYALARDRTQFEPMIYDHGTKWNNMLYCSMLAAIVFLRVT